MPGIVNVFSSNLSNIPHNTPKLNTAPAGVLLADTGYRRRLSRATQEHVIHYLVPWSVTEQFEQWVLGYSTNIAVGAAGSISRNNPAQDPVRPWLYAAEVELLEGNGAWRNDPTNFAQNKDGSPQLDQNGNPILLPTPAVFDNKGISWAGSASAVAGAPDGYARYAVRYSPLGYEIREDNDPLLIQFGEMARNLEFAEVYAIRAIPLAKIASAALLTFQQGTPLATVAVQEPATLLDAISTITLTWYEVPDLPLAGLAACVGHTNDAPFFGLPGYDTYPAETLFCEAPQIARTPRNLAGRVSWTIKLILARRPFGWNSYYGSNGTPAGTGYFRATFGGAANGPTVVQQASFGQLFQMPAPVIYQ